MEFVVNKQSCEPYSLAAGCLSIGDYEHLLQKGLVWLGAYSYVFCSEESINFADF